jgi:hypothetical protein
MIAAERLGVGSSLNVMAANFTAAKRKSTVIAVGTDGSRQMTYS